jgi:signal transduction histidine kinase
MTMAEPAWVQRVRRHLNARSVGVVIGLSLLVSTQVLFQPHLFELWELPDIARGWAGYFAEVAGIGLAMFAAVAIVDEAHLAGTRRRLAWRAFALTAPTVLLVGLIAALHSGVWLPASPWQVLGESLKFALLGAFVCGARAVQRHAERAGAQALELEAARRELEHQAAEAQLRLLQAQIEPHFLFNTLATVRRLYRHQPAAGAETIDNLMAYLRAALRQARRTESTLGEEFDLVRAYLQLFQVRMGPRLRFTLDLPPALRGVPFAPMVLVTLAENAIKHGLGPAELGGSVRLSARRDGDRLEVSVSDDGVGFSGSSGGDGVGLVNIRRQLAARHGDAAGLRLQEGPQGGVIATVVLPWRDADQRLQQQPAPPWRAAAGAAR